MFVLPAIAVVFFGYMALPWLYAVLCPTKLQYGIRGDGNSVGPLAMDRGQDDEYEALLALGFIPLGIYQASLWRRFDGADQFVLTHSELPIVCSLCQHNPQESHAVLTSADSGGRLIQTSSLSTSLVLDTRDCFIHSVKAQTMEQVFVAHVRVLNQWESQDFRPTQVNTLEEAMLHYQRGFENATIKKIMLQANISIGAALAFSGIVLPAALGVAANYILSKWQIFVSLEITAQAVAAVSLASTFAFSRLLGPRKAPVKNGPQHNALTSNPSDQKETRSFAVSLPAAKHGVIERQTDQKWCLPFRNTSGAKINVALGITVGIACFCGSFGPAILIFEFSKIAAGIFLLIGAFTGSAVVTWAVGFGFNRSWQQIEIDGKLIRSTERAWWFRWSRTCPISNVKTIKLDPIGRHSDLSMGLFQKEDSDWYVAVIRLQDTSEFRVAFAYSKEVLEPLAQQLADALGLSPDSVTSQPLRPAPARSLLPAEEKILAESRDLTNELERTLGISHAMPTAHSQKTFEFANAASKTGFGPLLFVALVILTVIPVMVYSRPMEPFSRHYSYFFGYPIIAASLLLLSFRLKRFQKFWPSKTVVTVKADSVSFTRRTAEHSDPIDRRDPVFVEGDNSFHFEDVVSFTLEESGKGVAALVSPYGDKSKILASSNAGFSPAKVEALVEYCKQLLLEYRSAKKLGEVSSQFSKT